jgi:hypothetical protein
LACGGPSKSKKERFAQRMKLEHPELELFEPILNSLYPLVLEK